MKPSILLDQAKTPDGTVMALYEHDGTYAIRVGGVELMSTRRHASEEKLAELVCSAVRSRPKARILIGGLGFGFTLRAALNNLESSATVVVSELMQCVVDWNKNPVYNLAADALRDRRVEIEQTDVTRLIATAGGTYDGIILDVDNGPAGLTTASNDKLYGLHGLQIARGALRPGGVLGIWSASASPPFAKLMGKAGFNVQVERATAHTNGGGWHTLFIGTARR